MFEYLIVALLMVGVYYFGKHQGNRGAYKEIFGDDNKWEDVLDIPACTEVVEPVVKPKQIEIKVTVKKAKKTVKKTK